MIASVTLTLFQILFFIVLFGDGELFRRRNIDMDGDPPRGAIAALVIEFLMPLKVTV